MDPNYFIINNYFFSNDFENLSKNVGVDNNNECTTLELEKGIYVNGEGVIPWWMTLSLVYKHFEQRVNFRKIKEIWAFKAVDWLWSKDYSDNLFKCLNQSKPIKAI